MNGLAIEELKKVQRDNITLVCFLVTMNGVHKRERKSDAQRR